LLRAGFELVADSVDYGTPAPVDAWRLVVGGQVVPDVVVDDGRAGWESEVNEEWLSLARNDGIIRPDESFLITVAGAGFGRLPWAEVRLGSEIRAAQILCLNPGEPEFMAMDRNGATVCSVTTEEDGVWITSSRVGPEA
jgi:hypothetical protein